jgi:hypothetical protein
MIRTMLNTIRFVRDLDGNQMRGYADGMLARYGYERSTPATVKVLTIAGAFGAGMAIGAGVGVLFAPKSGAETRQAIGQQVQSVVGKIKQTTHRGATNGRRVITDDPEIGRG